MNKNLNRGKNGQFVQVKASNATPWESKNKEAHADLLEKYPNLILCDRVFDMTGQKKTKTSEMIKAGLFPRPYLYGPKRWREGDIRAWINEQAA